MTSLFKQIDRIMELSLRVLRSPPGASPSILLPLFDPGIPREKPGFFQNVFKIRVILKKGLRNPVTDGNGLPRDASSMNIHFDIELIPGPGQLQGLQGDHLAGLPPKVFFHRPLVDDELPFSRFQPNPCDGSLSFACGINGLCHFPLSSFTFPPPPSPSRGEGGEGGLFAPMISVQAGLVSAPHADGSDLHKS